MKDEVILVDENDNEIGRMEKMEAHQRGELHRAVSVFVFNGVGKLLLQQRAAGKYHSPGRWSNTCCTHPQPGETSIEAAHRRLREEMGMDCNLIKWCELLYRAEFDNGLTEHEYDHIFIGVTNNLPVLNPAEVASYRYVEMEDLKKAMDWTPEDYTPWLGLCLKQIELKTKNNANLN